MGCCGSKDKPKQTTPAQIAVTVPQPSPQPSPQPTPQPSPQPTSQPSPQPSQPVVVASLDAANDPTLAAAAAAAEFAKHVGALELQEESERHAINEDEGTLHGDLEHRCEDSLGDVQRRASDQACKQEQEEAGMLAAERDAEAAERARLALQDQQSVERDLFVNEEFGGRRDIEIAERDDRGTSYATFEEERVRISATELHRRKMLCDDVSLRLEREGLETRQSIATKECDARSELEHYVQEELTVQALREKHLREQAQCGDASPKPRRYATKKFDRLLAPLQGKCMQPRDMPESVERLGKLSLHQRVREEIRMTRAELRRHDPRGTSSFLGRGHVDPYPSRQTYDDGLPSHQRSSSVCSRGSHHGENGHALVRSLSTNSAWVRDTSDRWNCSDFNLAGVPRYSPRRTKAKQIYNDPRRAQSGSTAVSRSTSCYDFDRERTPGPGSHTGPVVFHH